MSFELWNQPLRLDDKTPLYAQLEQIILTYIEAENLRPGDGIPSEGEFCEHYRLSRTTVRQAFKRLEERGLIVRRRGLGSFIAEPKVSRSLDSLYSFTSQLGAMGYQTSSLVLQFREIMLDEERAERLGLRTGEPVYQIERLRMADGKPMLLERTLLVRRHCPAITRVQMETQSLYRLLTQHGLNIVSAVESYEPMVMDKPLQKLLKSKNDPCAFAITRKSYTENGELFEYTKSVMPGRRSRLEITLMQNGITMSRYE